MKVLFIGQITGVLNGAILTNKRIIQVLTEHKNFDILIINSALRNSSRNPLRVIIKILGFFLKLCQTKIKSFDVIYFTPSSRGLAQLRDLLVLLRLFPFQNRIIVHTHDVGFFEKSTFSQLILLILKKRKAQFVFPSKYVSGEMIKYNFSAINHILYGYTDPSGNFLKKESKDFTILFYSNLYRKKGIYEFLKIIKSLEEQFNIQNIEIIISGNNGDVTIQDLNRFIRNLKITNKIILEDGWDYNSLEKIKNRSVLVSPTYGETFGLSILECMSKGIVPIANNVGGIPEIIENNFSGFLCNNYQISSYTEKIITLYRNPQKHLNMINNCIERSKFFDRKQFEIELINILNYD